MDLIWTNSYGGVSVDQICEHAGVNKGSFYHFFPSKSDLAIAAYEAGWAAKRAEFDAVFSVQTPPLERIINWCRLTRKDQRHKAEKYGRICGCPVSGMGAEMANQEEKLRQKCEELMNRVLLYVEAAITEAKAAGLVDVENPKTAAMIVQSLGIGLLLHARIHNDISVLDELEPAIMRQLGAEAAVVA